MEESQDNEEMQDKPRLHRKDTPHHLKNKRINPSTKSSDVEKVAAIIAQVDLSFLLLSNLKLGSFYKVFSLIFLCLFQAYPN